MSVGSLLLLVKGNVALFAAVVFFNAHDLIAVRCVLRPKMRCADVSETARTLVQFREPLLQPSAASVQASPQ